MVVHDIIDTIRISTQEVRLRDTTDHIVQFTSFLGTVSDFRDSELFNKIADASVVEIFGDHSGAITICYVQDNIPEVVDIEDTLVDSDWVATITIPAKELDPVHS